MIRHDIQDKPKEEVITWDVPPMSEYETLKDEYEGLKWRLIPKPGGAVMRPAAWYELWAATQQAAGAHLHSARRRTRDFRGSRGALFRQLSLIVGLLSSQQ